MIKAGGKTICCEIHQLIISVWNKEELPEEWNESIIVSIRRGIKLIVVIIGEYHFCQLLTKCSQILLSRLTPHPEKSIAGHQCGFPRNRSTIDHLICIRQILGITWKYNEVVHQLFVDFKKAYD